MKFSVKDLFGPAGDTPSSLREALCVSLVVSIVLAWAMSLGIRLVELEAYNDPALFVDGARILATHDGYAFLAGVHGASRFAMDGLTSFISILHSLTGLSLETIGFWLCPIMAAFAGLPACFVAARMGRAEAGAIAGLTSATCFGFLLRTRLGYLDNDLLTLFLAIGTASAFLLWLWPQCREQWLPEKNGEAGKFPLHLALAGAVGVGCFIRFYVWFYPSGGPIILTISPLGAVLGLLLARKGNRTGVIMGLTLAVACLQFGWPAILASVGLVYFAFKRPDALRANQVGAVAAGIVLVGLSIVYVLPYTAHIKSLFMTYLAPQQVEVGSSLAQQGVSLPSAVASVREAAKVSFSGLAVLMAGHWTLFILGAVGFIYAMVRRPLLALFLPLVGLGLAGAWLGTRFTMYGGVVFGLGAGVLVADMLRLFTQRRALLWAGQAALLCVFGYFFFIPTQSIRPQPVLSAEYALALKDAKKVAGEKAIFWLWWDQGYAAQYFAGRDTFGDGGRHSGEWLYSTGLVHSSTSAKQASQLMRYFGSQWLEQYAMDRDAGNEPFPKGALEFRSVSPMAALDAIGPEKATAFIESLRTETLELKSAVPEQYFVVAWDNFRWMNWISYYGNWNLMTGNSTKGRKKIVHGGRIDERRGIIMNAAGQRAKISELLMVGRDGKVRNRSWMRFDAPYCIANQITGEMFVLESRQFNSMMVQLLLGDPEEFSSYFTLVLDRGPWARVYKVK